jgi:hypothetical protein
MTDYRILVTGSREWDDDPLLCITLAMATQEPGCGIRSSNVVIVHGACPNGADKTAGIWARNHGIRTEPHPADWQGYGKSAGFIRNAEMVSLGADLCLAFYWHGAGNKGTDHCAKQAENAGIPVRRIIGGED